MDWNWKQALRAAVALAFAFVPFDSADRGLYDGMLRVRGATVPPSNIVLVTYTEDTLPPFTEKLVPTRPSRHPWDDSRHGALLRALVAERPKLVVFASPFDGYIAGSASEVAATNRALHGTIPVLFAAALDEEDRVMPPVRELVHGENFGFSQVFPDADNVVRHAKLVHDSHASLGLLAYPKLRSAPFRHTLLEEMRIDFRGPAGSYRTIDWSDLYRPENAQALNGKVVLVGRAENVYWQPTTPVGRMSRLEVQANLIDTFADGREITSAPTGVATAVSVATVALAVLIMLTAPVAAAWLALCGLGILLACTSFLLLTQFKVWLPVSNALACCIVTFVIFVGTRLRAQERQHWQVKQESEALREMDRFKNNFISLFSHDLKTPLARIQANLDRVHAENLELPAVAREALEAIGRANLDLGRLITDILKVTRMEAMRIEPAIEVIDLNRIVEESVDSLRDSAAHKKIRLVLDLEPLFSMEGDPTLLREVTSNLVENAIKYSPEATTVHVRTREQDGKVTVAVVDQGIGIPPEEVPRVTSKFYRGKGVSAAYAGTGLGLYLAKYFVELHGGALAIESRVGQGTTVAFDLPLPP